MPGRWPVERSWVILGSDGGREQVRSSDLLGYRTYGMLGAAGLGKTYELSHLAGPDRERGLDVRFERLALLGQTPDGLASQLGVLVAKVTEKTVVYLDALDEVTVDVRTARFDLRTLDSRQARQQWTNIPGLLSFRCLAAWNRGCHLRRLRQG